LLHLPAKAGLRCVEICVQWSSVPYTVCNTGSSTATRAVTGRHEAHATTHISALPTVVRLVVLVTSTSTTTDTEGVTYVAVLHRGTAHTTCTYLRRGSMGYTRTWALQ
jgi:hypothetical protein